MDGKGGGKVRRGWPKMRHLGYKYLQPPKQPTDELLYVKFIFPKTNNASIEAAQD